MAIANYEDRFVIPTAHRELGEDAYDLRGSCGFSFGNGCSDGRPRPACSARRARRLAPPTEFMRHETDAQGPVGAADLSDGRAAGGGAGDARGARRREGPAASEPRPRSSRCSRRSPTGDLYDLQERYVLLFDRTRSLSLHLFEHVHGESRDRGQAMVDLKALYERHGLVHAAPPSCPTTCRCSWSSSPTHSRGRGPRAARRDRRTSWRRIRRAARRSARSPYASVFCAASQALARRQAADRGRRGAAAGSRTRTPTTSRRSTRPGRRKRSPSAPARGGRAMRQGWPRGQGARRASPRARDAGGGAKRPVVTYRQTQPRLRRLPCATPSITSCSAGIPTCA